MTWQQIRSLLIPFFTVCLILGVSALVIAFGRGYRLDIRQNSIKPTGLVSATSDPIGAQVLIDTKLRTATNNSFTIDPGWYTIRIIKEGFIPWEKKLRIQGEVVTRADAFLFPTNPSLSPLTRTGIENPTLSPDGTKIAYTIPTSVPNDGSVLKAGLWIYELADRPLGRNRDPQLVAASDAGFNFSQALPVWSPDSKELLVVQGTRARLFPINTSDTFEDVTGSYPKLLSDWVKEGHTKDLQKIAAFTQGFIDIATRSAKIIAVSPDETKLLYEATASAMIPNLIDPPLIGTNSIEEQRNITPGKLYVYDSREDKNYFLLEKKELPQPTPTSKTPRSPSSPLSPLSYLVQWFPTSKHLLLTLPARLPSPGGEATGGQGKIDILEYDRTNWITIYSGPFEGSFVAPWSNGSRIVILTTLNPGAGNLPNLYTVNLR